MTDHDEFQLPLHGVDLNGGPGSNLMSVVAAVIHKDSFLIPYPYELRCASRDKVPETLRHLSKYGFYVSDLQAMKMILNEINQSSSKNTFEQGEKEEEGQDGEEMGMVEVPLTDTVDTMSVENGTSVNFRFFNISDYHQTVLFVRIEKIKDPHITLPDISLSLVTSLRA